MLHILVAARKFAFGC